MSKLSEEQVLEKFGVDDFSQLTLDQYREMESMCNDMAPDVIVKVIEQVPEFAKLISEALEVCSNTVNNGLQSNDKNMEEHNKGYQYIKETIRENLQNESFTFNERMEMIHEMVEVQKMSDAKDSENKKFILLQSLLIIGGAIAGVAAGGTAIGAGIYLTSQYMNNLRMTNNLLDPCNPMNPNSPLNPNNPMNFNNFNNPKGM